MLDISIPFTRTSVGLLKMDFLSSRSYWVGSMSWSPGGLFLACVLKRGSLLMVSRLGGLLSLTSSGCNVDFGPAQFLPLHPLVTYRYTFETFCSSCRSCCKLLICLGWSTLFLFLLSCLWSCFYRLLPFHLSSPFYCFNCWSMNPVWKLQFLCYIM